MNDIAILKLGDPQTGSVDVGGLAALPTTSDTYGNGAAVVVVGWGATAPGVYPDTEPEDYSELLM